MCNVQWKHNIFYVSFVELHFTVNHINILIAAQQCCYGKYMSLATMQIICTSFWNKLYSKYFALFLHSTYKRCRETKECSSACQMYSLAKQIETTYKLLLSFSFFVKRFRNYFTRSEGINHLWSNGYKMLQVCVWDSVMCVFVNAGKPHLRLFQAWGQSELLWRTRTPMTWHQIMGHKGPVLRPRCIGTKRLQAQLLLCTLCHCHLTAQQ